MRNIRKYCIAIFVIVVICYANASEIKFNENDVDDDGIKLRWPRHSKKSESTSESVKKQKQQQQEDSEALTRSQLAQSTNYLVNTPNGLATIQNSAEPMRNLLQNVPIQMRQMDNPFNAGGMPNYANNYPYPGYPSQSMTPMGNPGYLYGNPNMAFNGGVQPMDHANNNLIGQQLINGQQQLSPNGYATNFMGYGGGQPGLPHQGPLAGQQPFPHAYGNQLMGYGSFPLGQPGLQNNLGPNGEQFTNPMTPPGFPNMFGQQGQLPGMSPMNGNNFMGFGDPSSAGHLPQPSILNPLLGMMPFGGPPQNGINNGFGVPSFGYPEFVRNQRSIEEVKEE